MKLTVDAPSPARREAKPRAKVFVTYYDSIALCKWLFLLGLPSAAAGTIRFTLRRTIILPVAGSSKTSPPKLALDGGSGGAPSATHVNGETGLAGGAHRRG